MNKMLVFDYDGVIKKSDSNLTRENIKLINSMKSKNHTLMLSTGRLYKSLIKEKEMYDFEFDYYSCGNGNLLFDSEMKKCIWKNNTDNYKMSQLLIKYIKYIDNVKFLNEFGIYEENNYFEANLHLKCSLSEKHIMTYEIVNGNELDYTSEPSDKLEMHIFKRSNKTKTIEILQKIENIENDNIFVVGDGLNDIEMICKYDGYYIGEIDKKYINTCNNLEDFLDSVCENVEVKRKIYEYNKKSKHII